MFFVEISGKKIVKRYRLANQWLVLKHVTIVNDDSSVINK